MLHKCIRVNKRQTEIKEIDKEKHIFDSSGVHYPRFK
jgi:hypothetical protein